MFTLIEQLVQGVMSGLVGPLFTWLNKKTDDQLAGFQTGAATDEAAYAAYLQAYVQVQGIKAAQNGSPGAKAIAFAAGALSVLYYGAIVLDSTFHCGWKIAALPGAWATVPWIIIQSFIVVAPVMPMTTAVSAWLHRK